MRIKRSIKDEFEKVYLRFNEAKRDLPKASLVEMKSKDFMKVCRYTTSKCFYGNQSFLKSNGYDYDDVYSLSQFYGACFLGYKHKSDALDNRRYYLMMTASIMQRLNRFISWTASKMQSSEIVDMVNIDLNVLDPMQSRPTIIIDGVDMYGSNTEGPSLECQVDDIMEEIEELEVEASSNPQDKSKVKAKISKLKLQAREIRTEILKNKKEQNKVFVSLRTKLNQDPAKYEQSLVYYACTKHVSLDVRRAARRYCDKFGIDYKKQAEESISMNNNSKNYSI